MATKRALYHQAVTYRKRVGFTRRKDVWTCKRLTAEVEHLKQDAQMLRRGTECDSKSACRRSTPKNILWKGSHHVRHSWLG
jgi:hypothetical protein